MSCYYRFRTNSYCLTYTWYMYLMTDDIGQIRMKNMEWRIWSVILVKIHQGTGQGSLLPFNFLLSRNDRQSYAATYDENSSSGNNQSALCSMIGGSGGGAPLQQNAAHLDVLDSSAQLDYLKLCRSPIIVLMSWPLYQINVHCAKHVTCFEKAAKKSDSFK